MKKIILLTTLVLFSFSVKTNPIYVPPYFSISELYFDNLNAWSLELKYYTDGKQIDSLVISTSSGRSKIKPLTLPWNLITVITKDSLLASLNINPDGDFIKFYYYWSDVNEPDSSDILIFGNYANSIISSPKSGQSIVKINYNPLDKGYYCKCPTNTIGAANNFCDGTLNGVIYNSNGIPLANKKCKIEYDFTTDADGKFSTYVYAKRYKLDSIYVYEPHHSGLNEYNKNTPLQFDVEPGETITRNIFFTSTWVNIKDLAGISDDLIRIFPNPVNNNQVLEYQTVLPVFSADCVIEIMDITGRLLQTVKMDNYKNVFTLPKNTNSKVFLMNAKMNGKVVKTIRIIKNN